MMEEMWGRRGRWRGGTRAESGGSIQGEAGAGEGIFPSNIPYDRSE